MTKKSIDDLAEEILRDFEAGDTPAARAQAALRQARDAGDGGLRQEYLRAAQSHMAEIDPRRNQTVLQQLQAEVLALQGRGGDTRIAHVTPNEVVLPRWAQTPAVMNALAAVARSRGIDPATFRVGSGKNRINPRTGQMEFDDGDGEDDMVVRYSPDGPFPYPSDGAPGVLTPQYVDYYGTSDGDVPASSDPSQSGSTPAPWVPESLKDFHPNLDLQSPDWMSGLPFPQFNFAGDNTSTQLQSNSTNSPDAYQDQAPIEEITVTAKAPPEVAKANQFFDRMYGPLSDLAHRMNVPENIIIAHALKEGDYTVNRNNVFGFSDNGVPRQYASPEDSIKSFENGRWGKTLAGTQNLDDYLTKLGQIYNREDPKYAEKFRYLYRTFQPRLNTWKHLRGLQ